MRLYPINMSSDGRLRFGRRLIRGLGRVDATRGLAAAVERVQGPLVEAARARESLEEPVELASDDVAFGELDAEGKLRRVFHRARELDGDRPGVVTNIGFPDGLGAVVAPKGQAQADALADVRRRYAESREEALAPHRDALVALVDQAIAAFAPAYQRWATAKKALADAYALERLRRDEHRRTLDAVFGGIREALPGDAAVRNTIVPRLGSGSTSDNDDNDEPSPAPAPVADPNP